MQTDLDFHTCYILLLLFFFYWQFSQTVNFTRETKQAKLTPKTKLWIKSSVIRGAMFVLLNIIYYMTRNTEKVLKVE